MTTQAAPSFDLEYAGAIKAAQTANDLAHHRYLVINACMEALRLAGITNDAPLDQLVARLAGERDELRTERDTAESRRAAAAMDASTSVRLMEKARAQLEATQRQLADILAIVGTETPIAAFDLVTTWRTEKAGYMEEIATLRAAHVAQLAKDGHS